MKGAGGFEFTSVPAPDALNSALYAIPIMEVVGRSRSFRRAARIAFSSCRAAAGLANSFCLVRSGSADLGCAFARSVDQPRPLRRAFLLAYVCGILWYAGNCYWIYDTMLIHGGLPPVVSLLLLVGYSLVLGLYFGLFGVGVVLVRRASGSTRLALAAAPVFWAALELAASRITSVPWDQLGYSQVDNALLNQLAPWTGVYGISFVLVAVNALIAGGLLWKGGKPGVCGRLPE